LLLGTWKVNVAQSTYPPGVMPPQSSTGTFENLGSGFLRASTDGGA
jgi:hypothetical protein